MFCFRTIPLPFRFPIIQICFINSVLLNNVSFRPGTTILRYIVNGAVSPKIVTVGDINIANRYYFWTDGTIHDVSQYSGTGAKGNIIQKDGVYETNLNDWKTEGQGYSSETKHKKEYSLTNVGFPFGIGLRYGYNRNITVSAELDYYYFLTDFLDDASDRYATYEELSA